MNYFRFSLSRVYCFPSGKPLQYKAYTKRDKEVIDVLKTELEIEVVGTPDITALSDDERRVFFETIMARVLELAKERNEL